MVETGRQCPHAHHSTRESNGRNRVRLSPAGTGIQRSAQMNLPPWLLHTPSTGALESDDPDHLLRKRILTLIAYLGMFISAAWGSAYLAIGYQQPAFVLFGSAIVALGFLLYFLRSRNVPPFRFSMLSLLLFLPFVLQWSLAGYTASSAVV